MSHNAKNAKSAKSAPAAAKKGKAAASKTPVDKRLHESKIESPVRAMWDLCDSKLGKGKTKHDRLPRRKDVLALADKQGIAYYTARTQFQAWRQAYLAS